MAEITQKYVGSFVIKCFDDSRSLVEVVYCTKTIEDKQLRISNAALYEMMAKIDIPSVSWLRSSHQLGNVLTKRDACSDGRLEALSGDICATSC